MDELIKVNYEAGESKNFRCKYRLCLHSEERWIPCRF